MIILRILVLFLLPSLVFGKVFNDPTFTSNPHFIDKSWGYVAAGFLDVKDFNKEGSRVVIAVIDTGVDMGHEDLADSRFVEGYDFIDNKPIPVGKSFDEHGHGTIIAGIIAARPDNQTGLAGAFPEGFLMPIRVLDKNGKSNTAEVAKAIIWATDNGADIINLSLGGAGFKHDIALSNAIDYAFRKGKVIVSAAGNDYENLGINLDTNPVFPICNDNGFNMVIGVSAIDQDDVRASFAAYGKSCVDVVAPGKRILSTITRDPLNQASKPNSYVYASGTSVATAYVSALAGLIKAKYPFFTNVQIRDQILNTAINIDEQNKTACKNASCAGLLGFGKIEASLALSMLPGNDFKEGDVLMEKGTGIRYLLVGGKKRRVSSMVFDQRFLGSNVQVVDKNILTPYVDGGYLEPVNGTLIKNLKSSNIYYINNGIRQLVHPEIFKLYKFDKKKVMLVTDEEMVTWVLGKALLPSDGNVIRFSGSSQLYWVIDGVLRPVSRQYYKDKGLSTFKTVVLNKKLISSFAFGAKLY